MPSAFLMNEGFHIDHAGNLICSIYADLREPADRSPITTLIKGCNRKHAIELCKKIRISKPARFREYGEGLVNDPFEARASSTNTVTERINSDDQTEAQLLNDEMHRASELLESPFSSTVRYTQRTQKTTETLYSGKNGWIFCTSIEPADQKGKDGWRQTLPDRYDHTSHIRRPREFARALGFMVAEQLGPQGKEQKMTHDFNGRAFWTKHKTQVIYHGPVMYADDPYDVITSARTEYEFTLLPIFVKGMEYRNQCEYRFAVLAEEEQPDETVDLDVSLAMLGSMQERHGRSPQQVLPPVFPSEEHSESKAMRTGSDNESITEGETAGSSILDRLRTNILPISHVHDRINDPSTPITPNTDGIENLPPDLRESMEECSALTALRDAIVGPFSGRRVPGRRYVEVSSSAWHAEPCIRRLCSTFENPIKNISINEDNFVVIAIRFPDDSPFEGRLVIGPQGTGTYLVKNDGNSTGSSEIKAEALRDSIVETLKKTDLRVRQDSPAPLSGGPDEGG